MTILTLGLVPGGTGLAQTSTGTPSTNTSVITGTPLASVIDAALQNNVEVRTAQANLDKANAANAAAKADPSVLVAEKLRASHAATLAQTQLRAAKLSVMQSSVAAYLAVLQGQENVALQTFQMQVDQKALQVAQTKQQIGNATTLDVQNAQNTLAASQQTLSDAQAQLSLSRAKLATLTGLSNELQALTPTLPAAQPPALAELQKNVSLLGAVVAASHAVAEAELGVKLADNDYTPSRTLQDARITLANAQRAQLNAGQVASQTLASAYQTLQNATDLLGVAEAREAAAQKTYTQDSARLQSGTISAVELQNSQLVLKKAQYARLQAQGNVIDALTQLSVASGQDLIRLGQPLD